MDGTPFIMVLLPAKYSDPMLLNPQIRLLGATLARRSEPLFSSFLSAAAAAAVSLFADRQRRNGEIEMRKHRPLPSVLQTSSFRGVVIRSLGSLFNTVS